MSSSSIQPQVTTIEKRRISDPLPKRRAYLCCVFLLVQIAVAGFYFRICLGQLWQKFASPTDSPAALAPADPQRTLGFPNPSIAKLKAGSFQDEWEHAAQKSFLLPQDTLAQAYAKGEFALARLSLAPFPHNPGGIPLLGDHRFFPPENRLCDPPRRRLPGHHQKLTARAEYYNRLPKNHPDVQFYIFPNLRVADLLVAAGRFGTLPDDWFIADTYVREFPDLLHPAIAYDWPARGLPPEQALTWYYRTDHHWNPKGAYNAYLQLWQLFHDRIPDISPPVHVKQWNQLDHLAFYGSYARRAGYFDRVCDTIPDGQFNLPDMKVTVQGLKNQSRNEKHSYRDGDFPADRFANHNTRFFGDNFGLIEYQAPAGPRRLLVISDSHDNSIEPLLASHFQRTYFVDLRYYTKDLGRQFIIDDFIDRNFVTDVLFIGAQGWILGLTDLIIE